MPTASEATDILITLARLAVASVFLMAGLLKIAEGNRFVGTVRQFRLLPDHVVTPYARLLPWVELSAALLLFAGLYIRVAALLVLVLCTTFAVASVSAMRRHLNLSCNCFGLLYRERIGPTTLVRDIVLMLLCAGVSVWDHGGFALLRLVTGMILITVGAFVFSAGMAYRASRGFFPRRTPRLREGTQA